MSARGKSMLRSWSVWHEMLIRTQATLHRDDELEVVSGFSALFSLYSSSDATGKSCAAELGGSAPV